MKISDKIQHLNLRQTMISNISLESMTHFPALRSVDPNQARQSRSHLLTKKIRRRSLDISFCRLVNVKGIRIIAEACPFLEELRAKGTSLPLVNVLRTLNERPPKTYPIESECYLPYLRYLRVEIDGTLDNDEIVAFLEPQIRIENFEGFGMESTEVEKYFLPSVFGSSPHDWDPERPQSQHDFSFIPFLLKTCSRLRKIPGFHIAHSSMQKLASLCPLLTHACFLADESLRGTKQIDQIVVHQIPDDDEDAEPQADPLPDAAAAASPESSENDKEREELLQRKKKAPLDVLCREQFEEIERLCSGTSPTNSNHENSAAFSRLRDIVFDKYDWLVPISFEKFHHLRSLTLVRVFLKVPPQIWPPNVKCVWPFQPPSHLTM